MPSPRPIVSVDWSSADSSVTAVRLVAALREPEGRELARVETRLPTGARTWQPPFADAAIGPRSFAKLTIEMDADCGGDRPRTWVLVQPVSERCNFAAELSLWRTGSRVEWPAVTAALSYEVCGTDGSQLCTIVEQNAIAVSASRQGRWISIVPRCAGSRGRPRLVRMP